MKTMKFFTTCLMVAAFLGISIFGFAVLHQGMENMNCLASTLGGGTCVPASDGFGFAAFHLNAFKIFSNATPDLSLIVIALLLLIGVVLSPLVQPIVFEIVGQPFYRASLSARDFLKFGFWLALLEKRDPAFSF